MSDPTSNPRSLSRKLLLTGATGKVGTHFLNRLLSDERFADFQVSALCHNRSIEESERVSIVRGSISDRAVVAKAMADVTHVLHLATCKETPEDIMDVAVKGMFWLLEEVKDSPNSPQFILVGGDAGMGHFFYPHPIPVTETQERSAYPGCYALSKVLEEVMLEQYFIQYGINGCCLRAPWIMEKDDFKAQLSFGEDVFGGPRWCELVTEDEAKSYQSNGIVPVMLDKSGKPIKRNFVHVDDLSSAILRAIDHPKANQQLFNICMDEPVDYREMADYLKESRNLGSVEITTPYESTWLDNAKAKFLLGWRPRYDLRKLIDEAFDFQRKAEDPRIIYYEG